MTDDSSAYRNYCDSCSGVNPPDDFKGLLIEHWPDGKLKYRGQFQRGGRRIGQHMSFYENGALQEVSYWDEGWVTGTVIWFSEDGVKECLKDYCEHGGRTRSWTELWYGPLGSLSQVLVFRNGEKCAEWMQPEMREFWNKFDGDKIVQEAVRMVYPDEDGE